MSTDTQPVDLTAFCGTKYPLPYRGDGAVAASDAIILVVVPEYDGECSEKPVLKWRSLLADPWPTSWVPLPDIGQCTCSDGVTCEECDGKGDTECPHCLHETYCYGCDGTGYSIQPTTCPECSKNTEIGEALFDNAVLRRLSVLPNVRIAPGGPEDPAMFEFSGGKGAVMPLMPLRPDEDAESSTTGGER